jgi:hypothetical protein
MLAKGRFKVKVLPEIEPLKIVPVVPVAKAVTPVSVAAKVICPRVVVVMVMLEPATKLATPQLPEPWAVRSWPATVGLLVVAVPPRLIARTPVHPGTKVRVLAVVVLMLMVMLVSELVAT